MQPRNCCSRTCLAQLRSLLARDNVWGKRGRGVHAMRAWELCEQPRHDVCALRVGHRRGRRVPMRHLPERALFRNTRPRVLQCLLQRTDVPARLDSP